MFVVGVTAMDVLVVDDESEIRLALAELLREEGYSVGELSGGANLVQTVAAARPRLVLLDLTMPAFDAARTIGELHALGLTGSTAILALSGIDEAEQVAAQLELEGAVRKPFDLTELLAQVARYVGRTARPAHDSTGAHV